jgi:hypothetical protein
VIVFAFNNAFRSLYIKNLSKKETFGMRGFRRQLCPFSPFLGASMVA